MNWVGLVIKPSLVIGGFYVLSNQLLTDCCLDLTTLLNSSNIVTHFSISPCVSISIRSSEPSCCMVTPVDTLNMHGKCLAFA